MYYEESSEFTKKMFEMNLRKAVDMAASRSILLGFETMETEFMNTVGKAMKYVQLMGSDYLGVYPDIGNITNAAKQYKTDVIEDLKSGSGRLLAMHLKETVPGKFREIPYGSDWKDELRKANRMMTDILGRQAKEDEHAS